MPLVKIEIMKGHDKDYKKAVLQAVHEGLMLSLGIPDEDRFQRLYEIDPDYFETSSEKTNQFCMIELTLFPGRSLEVKEQVIFEITRLLGERLEIPAEDVFIVINDPPYGNWGFGGEQLK